jgi:aryl-alcohol dehydrogenase-like predicted oxidoreductase
MSYGEPATGELTPGSHAWALNEDESQPFLREALELGINFFDTANVYSAGESENVLGRFLKTNVRRETVVIATKLNGVMRDDPNGRGLSRKAVFFELEESLRRLQTDYVDLYQIHRWDYDTPIEETLDALNDVVRSGKVRYIGASSMHAWQFTKALYLSQQHGWARFVSMQNHYNLIYREEEREMMKLCLDQKIAVIPWSPLARGKLTRSWDQQQSTDRAGTDEFGKTLYKKTEDTDKIIIDRVGEIAAAKGVSRAQVALAWMLSKPFVTSPIIGATKQRPLEDALAAERLELSDDESAALQELYKPHAIAGHQ